MSRHRFFLGLFIACIALAYSLAVDARAGGGGGGGESDSSPGSSRRYRAYDDYRNGYRRRWEDPRLFKFLAAIGGASLIYYAFGRASSANRIRKAVGDFKRAHRLDPAWDISHIGSAVHHAFHLYQQAWMAGDLQPIQSLLHPDCYQQAERNLNATLGQGLINVIKDPRIISWDLCWVRDMPKRDGDIFIAELRASMIDYTINASTGWFVDSTLPQRGNEARDLWVHRAMNEPHRFTEYWAFMRLDGQWKLLAIQQNEVLLAGLMKSSDQALEEILRRGRAQTPQPSAGNKSG